MAVSHTRDLVHLEVDGKWCFHWSRRASNSSRPFRLSAFSVQRALKREPSGEQRAGSSPVANTVAVVRYCNCSIVVRQRSKHVGQKPYVNRYYSVSRWHTLKAISFGKRRHQPVTSSPPYSLTADAVRSLRVGLPVSTTRFAGTESVPVGSAVSAGVDSGQPVPTCFSPRTKML